MTKTTSSLELNEMFQVNPTLVFDPEFLLHALPDVDHALFFAQLYDLTAKQTGELLGMLFPENPIVGELLEGDHSVTLQMDPDEDAGPDPDMSLYQVTYDLAGVLQRVPDSEVLVQLYEAQKIVVAQSIQDVADVIGNHLGSMPKHEGRMTFQFMRKLNMKRNTFTQYSALVDHRNDERKLKICIVLDDSGSMSEPTIRTITPDVVALSYAVNATLVQVSSTARMHTPGRFNVDDILSVAEYAGTSYETLKPVFDEDWDLVICIADYDSYGVAKSVLAKCKGRIGTVLDVSLVNRQTYLSECLGQLADEVRPILMAPYHNPLC